MKVFRVYESTNLERFRKTVWKEAILWCQLYHVNVLPCYGVHHLSKGSPRIGLISPWVENGNVEAYLCRQPHSNRLLLISDVISGMAYLHRNKVVHGNLKAANILVTTSGRACLVDFGLSTLSDPTLVGWTSIRTSTAHGLGTARWQAPELFSIEDEMDLRPTQKSDVYSFACVCYEITTGNVPFYKHKKDYNIPNLVSNGNRPEKPGPKDRSFQEYGLTDTIWSFIESCWKQDPGERPTALELKRNPLFAALRDPRPLQEWGDSASATEFRRWAMPTSPGRTFTGNAKEKPVN